MLNSETFDAGLGSWTSGGVDAFYNETSQCLRLRDDDATAHVASSAWLTSNLDLTGYSALKINFDSLATNLSKNKKFMVQISADGGSTWNEIGSYTWNVDFDNDISFPVELTTTDSSYFTSSLKIKIECDAGSNRRYRRYRQHRYFGPIINYVSIMYISTPDLFAVLFYRALFLAGRGGSEG